MRSVQNSHFDFFVEVDVVFVFSYCDVALVGVSDCFEVWSVGLGVEFVFEDPLDVGGGVFGVERYNLVIIKLLVSLFPT